MRQRSFEVAAPAFRRRVASFAAFVLFVMGLPGTSFGQAAPQPTIAFLNPSSFATAGERGIIVSDAAPQQGPGCCDATGPGYHLSAWVSNAPPGSRVFFSVTQRPFDIEITDVQPSGASTWDAYWRIPAEIIDGPATIYAYLVVDDVPVAIAEQPVTIVRLQENTQIKYPNPGGSFGTYAALADELVDGAPVTRTPPVGVVDAFYTLGADATKVRAFYSTSPVGTAPAWKVCGTERVGTGVSRAGNGVRCTLVATDTQEAVTAVAAVTNDGPEDGPYEARFNQSGDAVAIVTAYAQQPANIAFASAGTQRRDRNSDSNLFPCSTTETVKVMDQIGRHIAGANVDVHATGPSDTLKFNADSLSIWTDVKPPDRSAHTSEPAYDCGTHPANSDPGTQGEHPRFGAPDRKHIESVNAGTTDVGLFVFQMRSSVEGVTEYTAWVDEADDGCAANDDTFTEGEVAVSGVIGWGQDPSGATEQPREAMTACVPGGPQPSESPAPPQPSTSPAPPEPSESPATPEPSESPTSPPGDSDDVEQRLTLRTVFDDSDGGPRDVRFMGALSSSVDSCAAGRIVVLKSRKIGGTFVAKQATTTRSTGKWAITRTIKRTREWRAVARPSGECPRVRSPIVRLKIRR